MNTEAKVIEVIEVVEARGKGVSGDPYRRIPCYVTLKGEFLAENDEWSKRLSADDIAQAWVKGGLNTYGGLKILLHRLGFDKTEIEHAYNNYRMPSAEELFPTVKNPVITKEEKDEYIKACEADAKGGNNVS